jgi:glycosyltransferase involved in cell wall biosynthesis
MKPLVSILIPAYNAEPWIGDAIRSALAQTWLRKEIIVVDDGSRDQTFSIARQFASETVAVLTQKNQGVCVARNKAFEICQGDYIQWLDGDDLLAPDKIARQMEVLAECPSKRTLVSSAVGYFCYRPSRAQFSPSPLWCDLSPEEWLLRKMEQNLHLQAGTWLITRELAQAAGPWDVRLVRDNDGEYSCRLILASDGIRFVQEARLFYRKLNSTSMSNVGRSDKKRNSQFLSMQLQINYLRSFRDDERVRAACLKYMQTWLLHFYPERPDIVRQLERLATALGGQLNMPRLRWKYRWMQRVFGYNFAKRAQFSLPELKWTLVRAWDKVLFDIENRTLGSELKSVSDI